MDFKNISILIRSHLWAQVLAAMVLGITVGLLLSPNGAALINPDLAMTLAQWFHLPGGIFLNLIQMIVIPLVSCSIIIGITSSGDPQYLKKVGLRIFPYFIFTTTVAVGIGILLALFIQPGKYVDPTLLDSLTKDAAPTEISVVVESSSEADSKSLPKHIESLIPTNINEAMLQKNMLAIVIYAIIMGVAILLLLNDPRTKTLLEILEIIQEISLKVVGWAMMLAPLAVFGLLTDITIKIGVNAILSIGIYMLTVVLGLIVLLGFYLLLVCLVTQQAPWAFLYKIKEVQLLAFSTSSSAAVMPLSIETATDKLKVDKPIANFIVPLGATINMDGTALYQVVAAVFLTQVFGIDLTTPELIVLTITTIGASIGSPSTPGVGIVILATILQGIGVPPTGIALIIGVDRLLDMCRTMVNVSGDLTACMIMNQWIALPSRAPKE